MIKKIVPSIMCGNPLAVGQELSDLKEAGSDWLHCDVMDGHFVKNMAMAPYNLASIIESGDFSTDIHLAVTNPEEVIPIFAKLKPDYLTFHVEAATSVERCISLIRQEKIGVGLALNPETTLADIQPYLDQIDLLLVMTVNPGFAGQAFNTEVLVKLAALNKLLETCQRKPLIEVDGNIYDQTIQAINSHGGANLYVVGTSALFNNDKGNYHDKISNLTHLIGK